MKLKSNFNKVKFFNDFLQKEPFLKIKKTLKNTLVGIGIFAVIVVSISDNLIIEIGDFKFKKPKGTGNNEPKSDIITGIDISRYNNFSIKNLHKTNEIKRNDGKLETRPIEFIIMRVYTHSKVDGKFKKNREELENYNDTATHKIKFGAYLYFDTEGNAEKQFDIFKKQVGDLKKGDITPIIDIEEQLNKNSFSKGKMNEKSKEKLLKMLSLLENEYGSIPMIYTGYNIRKLNFKKDDRFEKYYTRIARYGKNHNKRIKLTKDGIDKFTMFQVMEKGNIPGANNSKGNCDVNDAYREKFNKTLIDN